MKTTDVLDEIIGGLEPEDVPTEFIVMAKITDFQGNERVVRGDEMEDIIKNPDRYNIAEARVILNVRKLRKAIIDEMNIIYDNVNRMYNADKK